MKKLRILFFFVLVAFALAPGRAAAEPHVVLITLDGFPASMYWDSKTPIPILRNLAADGVVAEGMRVSNPSVTWPNHTTLVTGATPARHSVLFNGILTRPDPGKPLSINPKCDQSELIAMPTIFDLLHAQGFHTAAINWPCTRNSETLDDSFPDVPQNVLNTTPRLRSELVAKGILPDASDETFRAMTGPGRDQVWTRSALHVIEERKPHLLLIHLLNTDGVHHRYGPASPASETAVALADRFVGEIVEGLNHAGIRENTTIFVTADHGFARAEKVLHPNVLLRRAGLLELDSNNHIENARAQVVAEGGIGMVYLTNPKTKTEDLRKVRDLFEGLEGVAQLVGPDQYSRLGLPSPDQNPGMADLVIAAKDGYGISGSAVGDEFVLPITGGMSQGYHGYLSTNPRMNALFIAAGRGIQHGKKIGLIDNIDIAPTIAFLFGEKLPSAEGKVLRQILAKD